MFVNKIHKKNRKAKLAVLRYVFFKTACDIKSLTTLNINTSSLFCQVILGEIFVNKIHK